MKIVNLLWLLVLTGCATLGGALSDPYKSRATASAKAHTELAGIYFERTQMGIALREVELALQSDQNYAPAYSVRGLIHMALREYREAEDDFQKSLRLDVNDSETRNNYGWFLCQRGKEKESIPHFMAALRNPLYATPERAYLNAGLCSRKAGNIREAEDFLQRALQVMPGLPQALLAMAELKHDNGNSSAARKYFVRFAEQMDSLTAEQLWLALRIERKAGDRNSEASYAMQLRKRFPDAPETLKLMRGE